MSKLTSAFLILGAVLSVPVSFLVAQLVWMNILYDDVTITPSTSFFVRLCLLTLVFAAPASNWLIRRRNFNVLNHASIILLVIVFFGALETYFFLHPQLFYSGRPLLVHFFPAIFLLLAYGAVAGMVFWFIAVFPHRKFESMNPETRRT